MRQALLILLLLLLATAVSAHQGSLRVSVADERNGMPLDGAGLYLGKTELSRTTDALGTAFIGSLEPGMYTVSIRHIGYASVEQEVRIEDGVTTDMIVRLKPAGMQLGDIIINARKESALSTISAVDMKLRPVNSAQDLLRLVPGLFTAQHQGGGKAEQMFLRGFDVDHGTDVAVSVDGMPVNLVSHAHGQGYADLHFLIPELLESMSFGKGSYTMDKGNFATAGWVDFKTRDFLEQSFIRLEGGSFGYVRAVAGLDLLGEAGAARKEGAWIAGEFGFNRGYFERPQDFSRINLSGKYTKRIGKDRLVSVAVSGFNSSWDASGQIPERAVASGMISRFGEIDREAGSTSRYSVNVRYDQTISRNEALKVNLWAARSGFSLYSNFTFFLNDSANGDQIHQKEARTLGGYNAEYSNIYRIGGLQTKTQIGTGLRFDATDNSELSHTRDMSQVLEPIVLGDIREANLSGYVNQTFYILPRLVANAGTRFDYFSHTYVDKLLSERATSSATTQAFSPKGGIYYQFGTAGRIYLNGGIGFHSNDTRVVTARGGKDVLPLSRSVDLGIVMKPLSKLLLSAALFHMDLDQEFVYVGDEGVVEPGGRTRRRGGEVSLRYEAASWLFFDADLSYTHARARDEAAGQDFIPLAPKLTSIGGVTVRQGPFSGSFRYRHLGERPASEDNSTTAQSYTVCDLTGMYTRKKWELGFQVQNLFDVDWKEAQFDTQTRLRNEPAGISDICFTPGTPFFLKLIGTFKF